MILFLEFSQHIGNEFEESRFICLSRFGYYYLRLSTVLYSEILNYNKAFKMKLNIFLFFN